MKRTTHLILIVLVIAFSVLFPTYGRACDNLDCGYLERPCCCDHEEKYHGPGCLGGDPGDGAYCYSCSAAGSCAGSPAGCSGSHTVVWLGLWSECGNVCTYGSDCSATRSTEFCDFCGYGGDADTPGWYCDRNNDNNWNCMTTSCQDSCSGGSCNICTPADPGCDHKVSCGTQTHSKTWDDYCDSSGVYEWCDRNGDNGWNDKTISCTCQKPCPSPSVGCQDCSCPLTNPGCGTRRDCGKTYKTWTDSCETPVYPSRTWLDYNANAVKDSTQTDCDKPCGSPCGVCTPPVPAGRIYRGPDANADPNNVYCFSGTVCGNQAPVVSASRTPCAANATTTVSISITVTDANHDDVKVEVYNTQNPNLCTFSPSTDNAPTHSHTCSFLAGEACNVDGQCDVTIKATETDSCVASGVKTVSFLYDDTAPSIEKVTNGPNPFYPYPCGNGFFESMTFINYTLVDIPPQVPACDACNGLRTWIEIFDNQTGTHKKWLLNDDCEQFSSAGIRHNETWDGSNDALEINCDTNYIFNITVVDDAGNRDVYSWKPSPPHCGNGTCDSSMGEDCFTCEADCGACCGNGTCDTGIGEDCLTCPDDCSVPCGDGYCDSKCGETKESCYDDCKICGDTVCNSSAGETCRSCELDCKACCPNGACDFGENCRTCSGDCGACSCGGDCGGPDSSVNPVTITRCGDRNCNEGGINPAFDRQCASPGCCGMDPDCWCEKTQGDDLDLPAQLRWDTCLCPSQKVTFETNSPAAGYGAWGVCTPYTGKPCGQDSDCNSTALACDSSSGTCFLKTFVWITPKRMTVELGQQGMMHVTVKEPMNRPGTFSLKIDPTIESKYYAKFFGESNEVTLSFEAGEIKQVPVYFTAATSGEFELNIIVTDVANERIRAETKTTEGDDGFAMINVAPIMRNQTGMATFVSAPGLFMWQLILIALVVAVPFALARLKLKQKRKQTLKQKDRKRVMIHHHGRKRKRTNAKK